MAVRAEESLELLRLAGIHTLNISLKECVITVITDMAEKALPPNASIATEKCTLKASARIVISTSTIRASVKGRSRLQKTNNLLKLKVNSSLTPSKKSNRWHSKTLNSITSSQMEQRLWSN
jgi:hypothetical protein